MFVCLDTETIVMSSKDTEVVIGPDKDKAEGQLSSKTEELLLADHFGAFKGKNIWFFLILLNHDKMSELQTVQMRKAGILSFVSNLKAFLVQKLSQLPIVSETIESVEYEGLP